jgi:hypothetical protein
MPVNYLDINRQIPAFCDHAILRQQELALQKQEALGWLTAQADQQAEAIEKIKREAQKNPNLRCAVPGSERMDMAYTSLDINQPATILAADGSQVIPSRHSQVQFGALNIAAVILKPGSGEAPKIVIQSDLLEPELLAEGDMPASEAYIALKRDLAERKLSAELAKECIKPVVSLTDGGLELYREPQASKQYNQVLAEYVTVLEELSGTGIIYAGLVDKPGGNLVVTTLNLLSSSVEGPTRPSRLIDRVLFSELLNQSGSRSAIFQIQSPQAGHFKEKQAIHFFYLNTGSATKKKISRVEFPGWVAESPELLNLLQNSILQQCAASGNGFPYLLHRAHEEAVIQYADAAQLESILVREMQERGIALDDKSDKQKMKDLPGKRRMGV